MKSSLLKNTLTNYLTVFVRLLQGVFITRWTIHYLGQDYYGLWALLWSFFSYALLLDFGFGVSAQKYTSMEIFKNDITRYNRIISTIFSFHLAMFAIIALGTISASFFLDDIIRIYEPEKLSYCKTAFLIFGLGTACIFPLGMFSEILVGLQKLYLRNYINICSKIVELIGTITIFLLGGRLIALIIFVIILGFVTNIIMAFYTSRLIHGFKLFWKFDWQTCKEISGFSGFVYLMSISRLNLSKSSRLLISIFCGLSSVGIYHISSRLADFCYMATVQYQENIRPISANLHSQGHIEKLSSIIFNSLRWNMFISILIMLPSFIYAGDLVSFLFNVSDTEVTYISRLFIASIFCSCVCRTIPEAYLQMTDRHKKMGYVMMSEAFANLFLNIATLPYFGVASVLWNSISIRLVVTFVFVVPPMIKSLEFGWRNYFSKIFLVPIFICIPVSGLALAVEQLRPMLGMFFTMALGGAICMLSFIVLAYIFMLNKSERLFAREKVLGKIKSYLHYA